MRDKLTTKKKLRSVVLGLLDVFLLWIDDVPEGVHATSRPKNPPCGAVVVSVSLDCLTVHTLDCRICPYVEYGAPAMDFSVEVSHDLSAKAWSVGHETVQQHCYQSLSSESEQKSRK